jgi:hypothetical protein
MRSGTILPQSSQTANQLSLFTFQIDERIRRVEIDGVIWFSVLDTFEHYGNAKNPTTSWNTALKRLQKQGFDTTREILVYQFPASDGRKKKETPIATFKTMLRIAQVTDFDEWEHIRQWMADVAHEQLEELANPLIGMRNAERRLALHKRQYLAEQLSRGETVDAALKALPERMEAVDVFKMLTDEIKRKVAEPRYGQLINAEYWSMFNAKADELRKLLNSQSIRDALPPAQLSLIKSAELMIRDIVKQSERMTMQDLLDAVDEIVTPMGAILLKASQRAGVHHVTGKPLLNVELQ